MRVGDKVKRVPVSLKFENKQGKMTSRAIIGTVVYIHPKHRWHTVEFKTAGGPIRESYTGCDMFCER